MPRPRKRGSTRARRAAPTGGRPGGTAPEVYYNARPDTVDFRDRMYHPTLVEVPQKVDLARYRRRGVPVLDQEESGACTGFALATMCHYLLRTRDVWPSRTAVSPWMLYEMAKRYDEWSGTDYDGSSARGAMKGWHKHGVCRRTLWPAGTDGRRLTAGQAEDAARRPLGAYYRVNHKDLVSMHASLAEVGILYASAGVHAGWENVGADGRIRHEGDRLGGHAFAIVAYDEEGFWIQNSWGRGWGKGGFGRIAYDDWLENGQDVWVARLAVPVKLAEGARAGRGASAAARQRPGYGYSDLRPHVIRLGNDGRLAPGGTYGTTRDELESILLADLPRATKSWKKRRVLLFAHGGLVSEDAAIARVADYRDALLDAEVYPLAFVWRTDYWTTLKNMLADALSGRRAEGWLDDTKDFLLDRLDDTLEPIARAATGKAQWDEMKENALLASGSADGGARFVAGCLARLAEQTGDLELHLAAHSAGSILLAPVAQALATRGEAAAGPLAGEAGLGLKLRTCTLLAPAVTLRLFFDTYAPLLDAGTLGRLAVYTLDDATEQDDHCANIYHKSLLYLVSNAFEEHRRVPIACPDGEPLLGMAKFLDGSACGTADRRRVRRLRQSPRFEWVVCPNDAPAGSVTASDARRHGDFDDDPKTVAGLLRRITGRAPRTEIAFARSDEKRRDRRRELTR